ncbi:MAG TPA: 6,7-dimethyl-8-ribityllumazine synthase [Ignavibacteriaceae bacterium]|nr:6,7-dimethyl-8-ribityllumazine synthase [Ignavibacteriaceae bacterium]
MKIIEGTKKPNNMKFALVQSKFNESVCNRLLAGALSCFRENGINENEILIVKVPGAFEIPLIAETLASQKKYDAIICIGAVIKGETAHFEYISQAATDGIMKVGLKHRIPIVFGVITTYTEEQAEARAGEKENNKGWEAAETAIEMANLMKKLNDL